MDSEDAIACMQSALEFAFYTSMREKTHEC